MAETPANDGATADTAKLWKELTAFFFGLAVLLALFLVAFHFTLGQSRAAHDQETNDRARLFLGANVAVFLTCGTLLTLRKRKAALAGAVVAVFDVVLFLAGVALAFGRRGAADSGSLVTLLVPTAIWTAIALVIVQRTRAFLKATAPGTPDGGARP